MVVPRQLLRTRRVRAAAVLVGAGVLLAACGDRSSSPAAGTFRPASPGVLTVVTNEVPSPGFWSGTAEHPTGGFEYELARNLAQRFGLRSVRVRLESFPRIVAGQLDGADLALDLITPTSKRGKVLEFSTPYLISPPTVIVRSGTDVSDLETVRKLRWGAVEGTTFVGIIKTLITPHTPTQTFPTNTAMLEALGNGTVDAVLQDLPLAVASAERSGGRLEAAAQLPGAESIAAALPKGSANEQAVSSAIRAFTADGTIAKLEKRWIGSSAANADKEIPLLRTSR
jgi:polar amino acid transport system substrate-binding protein